MRKSLITLIENDFYDKLQGIFTFHFNQYASEQSVNCLSGQSVICLSEQSVIEALSII